MSARDASYESGLAGLPLFAAVDVDTGRYWNCDVDTRARLERRDRAQAAARSVRSALDALDSAVDLFGATNDIVIHAQPMALSFIDTTVQRLEDLRAFVIALVAEDKPFGGTA